MERRDFCYVCKKNVTHIGHYAHTFCVPCNDRLKELSKPAVEGRTPICMECQGTGFSGNDPDHPCPYCDAGVVAKRAKEIYDQRLEEARQEFKELLDESLSEAIEYRKGIEAERDTLQEKLDKLYQIPSDEWDIPIPPCDCAGQCDSGCEPMKVEHHYCEPCFQALCGEMYTAGKDKAAMKVQNDVYPPKAEKCPTCGELAKEFQPFFSPEEGKGWVYQNKGMFICPCMHMWVHEHK